MSKPRLILSKRSYDWVDYVAGTIMTEPSNWNVIILMRDDDIPIKGYVDLCEKAVYEQKRHDLFKIGKKIGIKKLMNFNKTTDKIDDALIMNLQLYLGLSGIKELYTKYYSDFYVETLKNICSQLDINLFLFGCENNTKSLLLLKKKIVLSPELIGDKASLTFLISDQKIYMKKDIEKFYCIKE